MSTIAEVNLDSAELKGRVDRFQECYAQITEQVHRVIVGQEEVLEQILIALFVGGHSLITGPPGTAKTLMVRTIATTLGLEFKRIQFTPDLMPSDITGTNVIDESTPGRRDFRFIRGPIFANIILADEINRTPPKTQAALLQSMQEREVTIGQETYDLPDPFFVIATQNPIEQEGTYPLPEAQLDRFMFSIWVDYPSLEEEQRILTQTTTGVSKSLETVLNDRQILNMQRLVAQVPVSEHVVAYTARLVRATRPADPSAPDFVKKMIDWGAGPRAGQYLILGAKAFAAMDGRANVSPEDIRRVAVPVLRHRIACNFAAQAEGADSVALIQRLLKAVPEPEPAKYAKAPDVDLSANGPDVD